jgi:hypothetical protein
MHLNNKRLSHYMVFKLNNSVYFTIVSCYMPCYFYITLKINELR